MKADKCPLQKVEEVLDDLEGSANFHLPRFFSGYWQNQMAHQCK